MDETYGTQIVKFIENELSIITQTIEEQFNSHGKEALPNYLFCEQEKNCDAAAQVKSDLTNIFDTTAGRVNDENNLVIEGAETLNRLCNVVPSIDCSQMLSSNLGELKRMEETKQMEKNVKSWGDKTNVKMDLFNPHQKEGEVFRRRATPTSLILPDHSGPHGHKRNNK